ncbi:MAG: HIT domain-containing protein [candidate division Zixibacteria bacterium]
MENLWAAWRRDFILGRKEKGCVFCNRFRQRADHKNLILFRGKYNIVIMNKYPYNAGHLMIVPKKHKGDLSSLTPIESNEFFDLTRKAVKIIGKAIPAAGYNIGMNIGADAGAGVKDHIHIHIVPRFTGDTNFMPLFTDTKVQSIPLIEIYDLLKSGFDRLKVRS